LQLVLKTMVRQVVPLQSMEVHGGADMTVIPIPVPLCRSGGRRERNGSEVEPRKKGGVGARCFKI